MWGARAVGDDSDAYILLHEAYIPDEGGNIDDIGTTQSVVSAMSD